MSASHLGGRDGRVCLPDGRWLSFAEFGNPNGPLVLYFHGTPGARLEAGLINDEACARGVRLVAVERPGIGRSTFQLGRQILKWPADIAALVDGLGLGDSSFGILAVSGGTPYALACQRSMPQRLTHVAIVSGHSPPHAPGVQPGRLDHRIQRTITRPRLSGIFMRVSIRMLHNRPDKFLEQVGENWSASDRQLVLCNPHLRRAFLANMHEAIHYGSAGLTKDVRLLGSNWCFRLNELPPVSTSIWQGGCDAIAPPSMGRYLNSQIAGSDLVFDPRAGHVTMLKWHAAEIFARFPA